MTWTGKPKRLDRIFDAYAFPVYFITAVTAGRRHLLANATAHDSLVRYAKKNAEQGRVMGRYVLMPDHLHFMVRLHPEARLSDYVRLLRQAMTMDLRDEGIVGPEEKVWQPGFFDRLLRTAERTSKAWDYMLANPVEAGLAPVPDQWPYKGEIIPIRF